MRYISKSGKLIDELHLKTHEETSLLHCLQEEDKVVNQINNLVSHSNHFLHVIDENPDFDFEKFVEKQIKENQPKIDELEKALCNIRKDIAGWLKLILDEN